MASERPWVDSPDSQESRVQPPDSQRSLAQPSISRRPRAQPPDSPTPGALRISEPESVAGGLPAVINALRHASRKAGWVSGASVLRRVNQHGGFDCPGCAWPDPTGKRQVAEFCENGAKAVVDEADRRRCDPAFFARHTLAELSEHTDQWLNERGRLTHPMVRWEDSDHYGPIAWDDAFRLLAQHLHALDSPDEAAFYTSGRTSNETAFLYQAFVREFGTNNLPDCSNLCHESSGVGLSAVIGVGKGTVTLECFSKSDLIVLIGQNPGTNHPRMLTTLEDAKRLGASILSINPLPEAGLMRFRQPQDFKHPAGVLRQIAGQGTVLGDLYLPVRVGGDVALLKGLAKALFEREEVEPGSALNEAFIRDRTSGYEAFERDVQATSWAEIVRHAGVEEALIREAANLLATSRKAIYCWAMGLTQHVNGVANVQSVVNVALLRGHVGEPGSGLCPVRGHSNVQGDRTMGIWNKPPERFLNRLAAVLGFDPPRKPGFDTVETIQALYGRRVKVLVCMGGNFLSASPDTEYTAEALRRSELTVHVATKLNRAHLVTGKRALILPCLGRTERDDTGGKRQFMTCENSMGVVQKTQGHRRPASRHLWSEPAIVAGMARAVLGTAAQVDYAALAADYDGIRDCVAAVVSGCGGYNARVRELGGLRLPNAAREGRFDTPDGKAHFTVHALEEPAWGGGRFLLTTIRSHDQFNTTIYGTDDRYRGVRGERRVVLMHPEDMAEADLAAGDLVDLGNVSGGRTRIGRRFAVVPYPIPRGCLGSYFPEANVLVPITRTAHGSNTPSFKSLVVSLCKSAPAPVPSLAHAEERIMGSS